VATSLGNAFPTDPNASTRKGESLPHTRPALEVLPSPHKNEGATDDNHLGHPPFARMLGQSWDLPRAGSVRPSFVAADLAFSVINLLLVSYVRGVFSFLPATMGGYLARRPYRGVADEFLAYLIIYCTVTLLSCHASGMYDTREPRPLMERASGLVRAIGFATALLAAFSWLSRLGMVSALAVGCAGILNLVTFAGWRLLHRQLANNRVITRRQARNVLIVGDNGVAHRVAESLRQNPHLGYIVAGFVSTRRDGEADVSDTDERSLGSLHDLSRIARAHFVDEILIAPPFQPGLVREVLTEARRNHLDVKVVPEVYDEIVQPSLLDYIGDIPVMSLHREPIPAHTLVVKRGLDIVLSFLCLIALHPLLLLIAIAIKLDSEGPIFYCAPRVGKKGCKFMFYKFRTMVADADRQKERLRMSNQRSGPFFKIANDPRITRVGAVLRKFSLDELPQLWNVLQGDMSLVGPRPHPLDDYAQYKLEDLRRLDVMPGITGLWQVSARKDPSFEKNLALDLEYIENWSPWQDFRILAKTLPAVLRASGE
jgi:exopolysaccharide biosynthesis polyprenyl glycosylphosphotransferase